MSLLRRIVAALGRDRALPPAVLARKVVANARAYVAGVRGLAGCDRVGARPRCFGRPRVDNRGRIFVGDDFAVSSSLGPVLLATAPGGRIEIGDGVAVNYGTVVTARASVRIGRGAMIGPFCVIADADVPVAIARDDERGVPVEIGEDVWLAARVVVRPGARIGKGAVIAAGSVVEGDIPERAVASGAPAKVLRIRDAVAPDSSVRPPHDREEATSVAHG